MSCPNSKALLTNTQKPPPPPTKEPSSSAQAEPRPSIRGRKPTSKQSAAAAAPKKIPQRGLGVAQLERLRMQEKWKKMTETPSAADHSPPLESVPVQYGAGGPYGGAARLYPGGGGGGGVGSGVVMDHGNTLYQHHHQMTNNNNNNYYYYHYQQHEPKNNASFEYYDNLSFNFKKKRFSGEIGKIGSPNSDHQTLQMGNYYNINNGNFNNNVGLNMYSNLNNINNNNNNNIDRSLGDHLTLGFGTSSKVPRTSSDPHNQGYGIMEAHKRVNKSTAATNEVVMEYEFFPGLTNDGGGVVSRGPKEMAMMRSLGGANNITNNNQEGSNHYYDAANNSVTANSGSTSSNNSVISYNYNLVVGRAEDFNNNKNNNSHNLDLSLRL